MVLMRKLSEMDSTCKTDVFHEDAFEEYFRPVRPVVSAVWGGYGLEAYGKDLETICNSDPNRVWTVVDGEGSSQWILPGFHHVNRICYLITEKPHHFVPVEVRVRDDALTPLGLRRQVNRLARLTEDYAAAA